jgi:hypothetical protein
MIGPTDSHGNLGRSALRNDTIAHVNGALFKSWMIAAKKSPPLRV